MKDMNKAEDLVRSMVVDMKQLVPTNPEKVAKWMVARSSQRPDLIYVFIDEFTMNNGYLGSSLVFSRCAAVLAGDINEDGRWFDAIVAELSGQNPKRSGLYEQDDREPPLVHSGNLDTHPAKLQ